MRQWLIGQLHLPETSIVNRKIPKKVFFTQGDLPLPEKNLFTAEIESIYLLSISNQQSMNIATYVTDEIYYAEVDWIYIKLRTIQYAHKIVEAVHKVIPNPLVLLIESQEEGLSISTCHKRLNKNDPTKTVLDMIESTQWFKPSESGVAFQSLLTRLNVRELSFVDLYSFYNDIHQYICLSKLIQLIGRYPSEEANKKELIQLLNQTTAIKQEIEQLKKEQKSHIDFGDKMKLHMQLKKKEQQASVLQKELEELC